MALALGAEFTRMEDINRDCTPETIDQMTNYDESKWQCLRAKIAREGGIL